MSQADLNQQNLDCFTGGGEVGERMQAFDWSATPLGPVLAWPTSLRTAVSICLSSRFPIVMYWGAEYTVLYNDAYSQILARKHPWALGRPAGEVWSEIWDVIAPMLEGVSRTGQATYSDDLLLILERNGFPEECYFSFSFSAIRREDGQVGGIFTAVTETTRKVISERRLSLLNTLASRATEAHTVEEACRLSLETLGACPLDVPFALLYLLDSDGSQAQLVGSVRVEKDTPPAPGQVALYGDHPRESRWPLEQAVQSGEMVQVDHLLAQFGPLSGGEWPEPPQLGLILPITRPGQAVPYGMLVAGVSPRRPLDEEYRRFLRLAAGQIAIAIANTRAHEEERRRAESLAELDRAKTEFFSNISHEFRTPLTLMLGPVQDAMADASAPLPPPQRERLDLVYRNSLRLLKLVNNLLDFSRIEARRMRATFEPIDLAELTTYLVSGFRSAIDRAGLRLVVDCPPLPEQVYADRELWENIVLNLVSNALKFTLEGEIAVRLRWTGEGAELTVSDTGAGIAEEELPLIFERFHRVRSEKARTYEGSGIGLALVRELVTMHGGMLNVESALGKGSTFRVFLPAGTAHLPPELVSTSPPGTPVSGKVEQYVEEALRWMPSSLEEAGLDGEITGDVPVAAGPSLPISPGRDRERILLVEDNADMRDYLRRLLSARWQVVTATNGVEALASIRRNLPDLVLSDMMLPGQDGFGLLQQVRSDPATREIPMILLSARAGDEARIEGLQAGASDYIVKPFSARELLARVESHLAFQSLRHEADRKLQEANQELEKRVQARTNQLELAVQRLQYEVNERLRAQHIVQRLLAISQRLNSTLEMELLLTAIVQEALTLIGAENGFAGLKTSSGMESHTYYLNGQPVQLEHTWKPGEGLPGRLLLEKQPYLTNDAQADQQVLVELRDLFGVKNVLAVPILNAAGEILGFFELNNKRDDLAGFSPADQEVLLALANIAGIAIQNVLAYQQIREGEARLQGIFENSPMGIVLVDPEGRYKSANPTFLKMLGYRFEEIEQKEFISLLHPEDVPHAWLLFQDLVSGKIDRYHNEKRFMHKDGHWVWVRMSRSVIRDEDGSPSYIIGMIEDISVRRQVEAELETVQRQLLENVEAERLYFSQEVHDGPIQNLVALLYEVALAQTLLPENVQQEVGERLDHLKKGLKRSVGELRDICKELRPPELERYGLGQIIAAHAASFKEKHPELELKVDMLWDGKLLPERTRLALFRIYQQALANTLRHAQASQVDISLRLDGDRAVLVIADNGKGFRVPSRLLSLSRAGHLGLIGSAERIKAVGGEFQVMSEPGKGTEIHARVPVRAQGKARSY